MIEVGREVDPHPPTVGRMTRLLLEARAGGRPVSLSVDGRESLTIDDEQSIQKLIELVDELETVAVLKERLASLDRGERGFSLDEARAELRRRRGRAV